MNPERWSNLWSRKFRGRVGRIPRRRSIDRSKVSGTIPDFVSPYGWEVARRSGVVEVDELRRLDPVRRPDRFRSLVQGRWVVVRPEDSLDQKGEFLMQCAQAVGTPVISKGDIDRLRSDHDAWQQESFRQWSATLNRHRLFPYWDAVGRPSVTVVVPSNRPANVDVWVPIVASQTIRPLQVVVGCHGSIWTRGDIDRLRGHLADFDVDAQTVVVSDGASLGEVLASASQQADGDVLVKWDDDDLYSSTHLVDLLRARHYSGATIVGKASDFVYVQSADVTVRRVQAPREIFSPTLSGSTLTIARRDLHEVGGWAPLADAEDVDLITRVRRAGGSTYRTIGFGFLVIRKASTAAHTWNPGDQLFLAPENPRRSGLAADWAMIDQPAAVIRRAASADPDEQRN